MLEPPCKRPRIDLPLRCKAEIVIESSESDTSSIHEPSQDDEEMLASALNGIKGLKGKAFKIFKYAFDSNGYLMIK